jgi:hypothetical protein
MKQVFGGGSINGGAFRAASLFVAERRRGWRFCALRKACRSLWIMAGEDLKSAKAGIQSATPLGDFHRGIS